MPLVAALPAIAGVVGIGSTIAGAVNSGNAISSASQAQQQANAAAIAEQQREFNTNQTNFAPYLAAGTKAVGAQGDLLGLNGNPAQQSSISALQASPLYQSLFNTGQNTILANAAATGGLRGGNTQNSLARFGGDTLAQVIQNQLQGLGGVAAQGEGAANSTGTLGANSASNIGNLIVQNGANQAGGIIGNANVNNGLIKNLTSGLSSLGGNSSLLTALGLGGAGAGSGGFTSTAGDSPAGLALDSSLADLGLGGSAF